MATLSNALNLVKNEDRHEMTEKLNARSFFFYLLMLGIVFSIGSLLKGGLFVDQHEGDMLHLIDITLRMADGEWPHIDFVTPLGSLAFLPFSTLVSAGLGVGQAFLWGQVFFAALVLPMVWWVGVSRLTALQAYGLGGAVMIMSLALIYGNTDPYVSMSMHYNRWAWALAFLAIPVAIIRPKRQFFWADGAVLGLAMAFFAFGKITYAVALAPGLIFALSMTRQWKAMGFGVVVFASVAVLLTIAAGPAIWGAYLGDLRLVSGTVIRPRAGESLISLLFSPKFVMAHAILLASIVMLRQSEHAGIGAMIAVFAPGFVFVCYQNYGNDPKWLLILALILVGLGPDVKLKALGIAAALLIAPSFVNMGFSTFRHAMHNENRFMAVSQGSLDDIHTMTARDTRMQVGQSIVFEGAEFASLNELAGRSLPPEINGREFPRCLLQLGLLTSMRAIAQDIEASGLARGKSIFTADTFGSYWLFGDIERTQNAAPWYYGRLSGFDEAELIVVPTCAITPRAVKSVIDDIAARGVGLREIRNTEFYTLFEKL
jgi:hypothetical protein